MESQTHNTSENSGARRHTAGSDAVIEANHRAANSLALLGGLVRMQARVVGKIPSHITMPKSGCCSMALRRALPHWPTPSHLASIPAEGAFP